MNRRQLFKSLIIKVGAVFTGLFAIKASAKPKPTKDVFCVKTGLMLVQETLEEYKKQKCDIGLATYVLDGTEEEIFRKANLHLISLFAFHYSSVNNTSMIDEKNRLITKYSVI